MVAPTPEPLGIDLHGRVGNTRVSHGLMAVFEAVANAIQAVDEAGEKTPGRIDVHIVRRPPSSESKHDGRVIGFRIEDHGVGFTDENYISFKRSDTTRKRSLGGHGVGRLTWLRVFGSVQIDSEYDIPGNPRGSRSFLFNLEGVTPENPRGVGHRGTVVTLSSPDPSYAESLQVTPERLAHMLVEHCLLALLDTSAPPIYINAEGEDSILLRDYLNEHFLSGRDTTAFDVKGVKFSQVHLLIRAKRNSAHLIHLCAAKRSVKQFKLSGYLQELTGPLKHPADDKLVVYAGYVTSELLDKRVYQDRDNFWLEQAYTSTNGTNEPQLVNISQDDIETKTSENAATFLEPLLGPYRAERTEEVTRFVQEEAPQFRYILAKHPTRAIAIKAGASKLDIYQHLSRIEFEHDSNVETRIGDALATIDSTKTAQEHATEVESLLAEVSAGAQAKLAKYVLYRRAVISILEKHQGLGEDGRYQLEKTVHQTVFPMGHTSDTSFTLWNLWLIDERLAFHRFLASDIPLNELTEIIRTEHLDRPDIAIFNRPMGFTESNDSPFGSIVLVDFKRPSRKKYQEDKRHEDPVLQVTEYMRKLLAGEAKKPDGSFLRIPKGTPFYAYVIADLTPPLIDLLQGRGFLEMPDKRGYFQYNPAYCAYIEVMEYEKLIQDAKKRNSAFFAALSAAPV